MVQDTDPRRFVRVRRHIRWIVKHIAFDRGGGAEYIAQTRACNIEFREPDSDSDYPYWIAWYASVLVHEATHGVINSRGIPYSPEMRVRIERLCVTEQNRFLRVLARSDPETAAHLHREFDESRWYSSWHATFGQRLSEIFRAFRSK